MEQKEQIMQEKQNKQNYETPEIKAVELATEGCTMQTGSMENF